MLVLGIKCNAPKYESKEKLKIMVAMHKCCKESRETNNINVEKGSWIQKHDGYMTKMNTKSCVALYSKEILLW